MASSTESFLYCELLPYCRMTDKSEIDLEPGDFVYQSDQELFLVVMEEGDDSYHMAAHGWREIGKERLTEYVQGQHGKLYRQEEIDEIITEEADDNTVQNYERLHDLFSEYSSEFEDDGPHKDFALEDN